MASVPTSTTARRIPSVSKLIVPAETSGAPAGTGPFLTAVEQPRTLTQAGSFLLDKGTFVRHDIAIWESGVAMKDAERNYTVNPQDLQPLEILGRGASSYVQRAVHVPTGQPLALKVINIYDKTKRDQLIREINALYQADCDALVAFHGAFVKEGTIVLALEFMDGGSLSDIVAKHGPIPEPVLAGVAFQILWGLAYLRVEKRLHRDLKPGNVLINSSGAVKLADFGLSAELANSIGMAQTYVGTCKYMAPERVSHNGYSFPSDIWSAGLLILEAGLGKFPLPTASSYIEMAVMIVESPDIIELPPDARGPNGELFSPEFSDFVSKCLRKNPEARWNAETLLAHPWFARWGVVTLEDAWALVASYMSVLNSASASGAAGAAAAAGGGQTSDSSSSARATTSSHGGSKRPASAQWSLPPQYQAAAQAYLEAQAQAQAGGQPPLGQATSNGVDMADGALPAYGDAAAFGSFNTGASAGMAHGTGQGQDVIMEDER